MTAPIERHLRRIGGHTVESLGHTTPMFELDRLREAVCEVSKVFGRALKVIEVGSWVGESAVAIAQGLIHGGSVLCVDDWGGNAADQLAYTALLVSPAEARAQFERNCQPWLNTLIRPLCGRSLAVAAKLPPQGADLIYLDAEHTYEAVRDDIAAWRKHLCVGGVMMGHDYYLDLFPGVVQAVDEAFPNVTMVAGTTIWCAAA